MSPNAKPFRSSVATTAGSVTSRIGSPSMRSGSVALVAGAGALVRDPPALAMDATGAGRGLGGRLAVHAAATTSAANDGAPRFALPYFELRSTDMGLTLGIVTDLHFGPEVRYRGKLRKMSHHAAELTEAVVRRMRD